MSYQIKECVLWGLSLLITAWGHQKSQQKGQKISWTIRIIGIQWAVSILPQLVIVWNGWCMLFFSVVNVETWLEMIIYQELRYSNHHLFMQIKYSGATTHRIRAFSLRFVISLSSHAQSLPYAQPHNLLVRGGSSLSIPNALSRFSDLWETMRDEETMPLLCNHSTIDRGILCPRSLSLLNCTCFPAQFPYHWFESGLIEPS